MKNQITYTEHSGLYYPDLAFPKQIDYTLGKYANLYERASSRNLHHPAHRRTIMEQNGNYISLIYLWK